MAIGDVTKKKPLISPPGMSKPATPQGGAAAVAGAVTAPKSMVGSNVSKAVTRAAVPMLAANKPKELVNGTTVMSGKPSVMAPQMTGTQNAYFDKQFGGTDKYIQDQLTRFQGGDADLQGLITKDLQRFGVTPPQPAGTGVVTDVQGAGGGMTDSTTAGSVNTLGEVNIPGGVIPNIGANIGAIAQGQQGQPAGTAIQTVNGQQFIQYPDGRRELVDTETERSIANELSGYERALAEAQAAQAAQQAANQQAFDYSNQQLKSAEAVDIQGAQELQNRRGGFYSGGLDYQLGSIGSAYAGERGRIAQDYNRVNQELNAKYGAQTLDIRNNINSLLTSAPDIIAQRIAEAAAAKKAQALEESKTTGIYFNPENESDYNRLLALKQQAEAKGITKEARAALSSEADQIRGRLKSRGVDISKLGAGSTAATAGQQSYGTFTEARRQEDRNFEYNKSQDTIANQWEVAAQTGVIPDALATRYGIPKGTKTQEAQQRVIENLWTVAEQTGTIPDELADLYNIPRGTQTQAAYEFEQGLALDQDAADLDWYSESREDGGSTKPEAGISPTVAGDRLKTALTTQVLNEQGAYVDSINQDYDTVADAFVDAYNLGVADGKDVLEMLARAGVSSSNITKLKAEFPQAFKQATQGK